jgi:hypothetical protein
MVTKAWTADHASRSGAPMSSDSAKSRARRRPVAVQLHLDGAAETASIPARSPRSFFWPLATQHVTRIREAVSLRDVSAAIAAAGAFALWALALSLLVV